MNQDFEFKEEPKSESSVQRARDKMERYGNFFQKVSQQYLHDPFATMVYFKDCYQYNRLDKRYLNPPLNFSEEIGEGIQDVGSNLLE